ncbi:hypothetical protein ACEV6Q_04110 [Enterobacter ludwigii]|uniref:hypothetical protein n=1 Tax=Enterobacter ludwigii TaxID=299767 RepID=UPI003BEEC533
MNILISENKETMFREVAESAVFKFEGLYFMKTQPRYYSGDLVANAVNIYDGELVKFCEGAVVETVNGTYQVKL